MASKNSYLGRRVTSDPHEEKSLINCDWAFRHILVWRESYQPPRSLEDPPRGIGSPSRGYWNPPRGSGTPLRGSRYPQDGLLILLKRPQPWLRQQWHKSNWLLRKEYIIHYPLSKHINCAMRANFDGSQAFLDRIHIEPSCLVLQPSRLCLKGDTKPVWECRGGVLVLWEHAFHARDDIHDRRTSREAGS